MGRIGLAFRVFFRVLFDRDVAGRVAGALNPPAAAPVPTPAPIAPVPERRPEPRKPVQSEAVTLLATLQREARLVDFLEEDISHYTDDQIGAAVRSIHEDARRALQRMFALQPVLTDEEGARVQVPAGFDAARYRLTGKVVGEAPYHGTLRHHGWQATRCDLPQFTGTESAARTVAPAEVEVQ